MTKILYGDMSWPEVKKAAEEGRVPLVPIGSTEQHGPHLPQRTDALLVYEVCKAAAKRISDEALVMPLINYGYNEHHLEFPGPIHINHETLIRFAVDIGKSLAHHGFKRMIIVNGHGSNHAPMEIAAKRITVETQAICASLTYLFIAPEVFNMITGESAHGGDIETSLTLYIAPDLVDMSKAKKEWNYEKSKFIKWGVEPGGSFSAAGGTVKFMDWFSRMSKTGVLGDPTKASKVKGEKMFKLFEDGLVEVIQEFRGRKILPRKDYH